MSDHPYEINKFFADMSDILQVDVEILRSGKKLTEIVRWDSLSVISFIAQVDEEVGPTRHYGTYITEFSLRRTPPQSCHMTAR